MKFEVYKEQTEEKVQLISIDSTFCKVPGIQTDRDGKAIIE